MKDNKWIQKAVNPKNKGALRKKLGVKKGEVIPLKTLKKAENSNNKKTRMQTKLAITLRKLKNK
jgi:hypothetical protein